MINKLAFLIGVDQYQNFDQLPSAAEDASRMSQVLQRICGFEIFKIITGKEADHLTILKDLRKFFLESYDPNTLLLLYFSGNAFLSREGRKGYLGCFDTELHESLVLNALEMGDLREDYLEGKLYARQVLIILDCCNSGAFLRRHTESPARKEPTDSRAFLKKRIHDSEKMLRIVENLRLGEVDTGNVYVKGSTSFLPRASGLLASCGEFESSFHTEDKNMGRYTASLIELLEEKSIGIEDNRIFRADLIGEALRRKFVDLSVGQSPLVYGTNMGSIVLVDKREQDAKYVGKSFKPQQKHLADLENDYDFLNEQVTHLKMSLKDENDPASRFKIKKRIDKAEAKLREYSQQIKNLVIRQEDSYESQRKKLLEKELADLYRNINMIEKKEAEEGHLITDDLKENIEISIEEKKSELSELYPISEVLALETVYDSSEASKDTECFNWLHLTDFHMTSSARFHELIIEKTFFEDLRRLHDKCGPWDLVFASGDLTQHGKVDEFERLDEFLERLWKCFENMGSEPKLLAVPGNHDIFRPNIKYPVMQLFQLWDNDLEIQTDFWENAKSPYRRLVTSAFKNYVAWWASQPFKAEKVSTGILPGDFSVTIKKNNAKLGIVGLNTAFLQLTGDNYKGKLAIHTRQFHEMCDGDGPLWAKQHNVSLFLTHHPPEWLNYESQQHLYGEIITHGHFPIHLCGHKHNDYSYISENAPIARRIWQGYPLFGIEYFGQTEVRMKGYVAGRIELSGDIGNLLFWPREARLQGGTRIFVPDHSLKLTDEQHTIPKKIYLLRPYVRQDTDSVHDQKLRYEQQEKTVSAETRKLWINPYIVGPPVVHQKNFYGRIKLLEWLRHSILQTHHNSIVMYGQRRIGKTSLLHHIPKLLGDTHECVYFDLQGHADEKIPQVLAVLADKIRLTLLNNKKIHISLPDKITQTDFQSNILNTIFKAINDRRLIILFDEFDVLDIDPQPDSAANKFLPYLQDLLQLFSEKLIFIFVVGRHLDELSSGFLAMFKGSLQRPISFLEQDDAKSLLCEPVKKYYSYSDQAVEHILNHTACHPYFTQLLGHECFRLVSKSDITQIMPENVESILSDAFQTGKAAFEWLWDGFPLAERFILSAIATAAKTDNLASRYEIYSILERYKIRLEGREVNQALKLLKDWEVLIQRENHYQFQVELFRQWIVKTNPIEKFKRNLEYQNRPASNYFDQGRMAHDAGDFKGAIAKYEQAIKLNSYHTGAYLGIAQALSELEEFEKAIYAYEKVAELDEDRARQGMIKARLKYADTLSKGNPEHIVQLEEVIKFDPSNQEANKLLQEVRTFSTDNDFEKSLSDSRNKSLQKQIQNLKANLLLLEERISQYLPSEVPLQLIIDKKEIENQIENLQQEFQQPGYNKENTPLDSLERILNKNQEKLILIEDQISHFISSENAPLDMIMERENLKERIKMLEKQISEILWR
ncbi:MAG: AAA family ATPase [Desulfobacterales bacterium]|nr:AAA family ATPase [Desulfobacterales bacterium]